MDESKKGKYWRVENALEPLCERRKGRWEGVDHRTKRAGRKDRSLDDDDVYESEEGQLIAEGILSPPRSSEPLPDDFFDDLPFVPGNRAIEVLLEERYGD